MTLPFQTPGYEHLELSTQILIREALSRGVQIEILDAKEQFLRLKKGKQIEYIKEATKTSKDTYITSLLMENKAISKLLLSEKGIRVPEGKSYSFPQEAFQDFELWGNKSPVVKPKNTNFGIGVQVFQNSPDKESFQQAIQEASKHGSFLIEEFLPGKEYRFLVINGECRAVLHRVPANITGDGIHSIEELIDIKNKDPRRGVGHITPLEKIQLGEVELFELQRQGHTPNDIPEQGQTIYLRKNSNISTGGDSIDQTDQAHTSYKEIAIQAAEAVFAKICGVDLIAEDIQEPASSKNHGVIEVNFNPVLYFHDFPYIGSNRKVERALLDLLGF